MRNICLKRIYEDASSDDGYRVLVDRLWPRGISKERAALDEWLKEIAPSTALRKWFGHKPERYAEFKQRYKAELDDKKDSLDHLCDIADKEKLTLLFGAKNETQNQAVVLKEVLEATV